MSLPYKDYKNIFISYYKNPNIKRIFKNFLSLSALNGLSLILPLLTLPYLVRVLGPEKYGITVFAYSLMIYFIFISNYGFQLSATKQISIYRKNKLKLAQTFYTVLTIRIILICLCFLIMLLLLLNHKFSQFSFIYFTSFPIVIGNSLIPSWFFQGLEKMGFVTLINAIPRIVFTILTFFVIKLPGDYIWVNLLISAGSIIGVVFSLIFAIKLYKLPFVLPNFKRIIYQFRYGYYIFISTISVTMYRESNTFLLGLLTNYKVVGFYTAAEKIIKAFQSIITPLSESLFPFFSFKYSSAGKLKESLATLSKLSKYYSIFLLGITLILIIFSKIIINIVLGPQYYPVQTNIIIMAFVVFFGGLNYLYGIIGLINLGHNKDFTKFILISGVTSLTITILSAKYFLDKGASFAMLTSELLLFILIMNKIKKIKKNNDL